MPSKILLGYNLLAQQSRLFRECYFDQLTSNCIRLISIAGITFLFLGGSILSFVLSPMLLASLALAVIVSAFIVFDGESIWLEGLALVGLYCLIAVAFGGDRIINCAGIAVIN
jgi:hypothetical protein